MQPLNKKNVDSVFLVSGLLPYFILPKEMCAKLSSAKVLVANGRAIQPLNKKNMDPVFLVTRLLPYFILLKEMCAKLSSTEVL